MPELFVACAQVVPELPLGDIRQFLSRFDLDDDLVFDDHVHTVQSDVNPFKDNCHGDFSFNLQASESQRHLESLGINRLQKAKAEPVVYPEETTNNHIRQVPEDQWAARSRLKAFGSIRHIRKNSDE